MFASDYGRRKPCEQAEGVRVSESFASDFEDGGRVHDSRNATLEARQGKETDSMSVSPG